MAVAIDCPTARAATAAAGFLGRRRRTRGTLQPPVGELAMAVAIDCPTARTATAAAGFLGRRRRTLGTLQPPVGELAMAVAIDCPTARTATAAAGFLGRRRRTRGTLQPPVGELCRPVATACPPPYVKERAELKPSAVAVTAVVIASYAAVLTAAVADLSASGPADLPIAVAALENRAAALLMTVAALNPLAGERPFGL
jgi:hypothetical protein